jgi:uncharacterized membrane protein YfcA
MTDERARRGFGHLALFASVITGTLAGVVLWILTDDWWWTGIGLGIGAIIGTAFGARGKNRPN